MAAILFIDEHNVIHARFNEPVKALGHSVHHTTSFSEALAYVSTNTVDVAFLAAQQMSEMATKLRSIRNSPCAPEIIVVRQSGTPEEAELAIKSGAWDYVEFPNGMQDMALLLSRVLEYRAQRSQRISQPNEKRFEGIVGNSPQIQTCLELVSQAADSDAHVLIIGETGTGKELFASAIHANSARSKRNFVVVDCAALPENLVESTLLGHEKGAFTGADKAHIGLIKQADGGTLFLDEVSELPLPIQKSFLRVLQERRFRPVGGTQEVLSNFRIIAASNRNLIEMVERGEFRKDLLFRIRAFTLELPPLRERPDDIAELVQYHVPRLCDRMGMPPKDVSPDFFQMLEGYSWPGNARELVNALERAIVTAREESRLFPAHLPTYIRVHLAQASVERPSEEQALDSTSGTVSPILPRLAQARSASMKETEKRYLNELLIVSKGDIKSACIISGLSRSRLYSLLKKYDISFGFR